MRPEVAKSLRLLLQVRLARGRRAEAEPLLLELLEASPPDSEEHAGYERLLEQVWGG